MTYNNNLYIIRGNLETENSSGFKKYDDICKSKFLKSKDKFFIYQYYVIAKSEREAKLTYIPYVPLDSEWEKRYFFTEITCIEVCKNIELNYNWPLKNQCNQEFIYSEQLSKIGYNERLVAYQVINKLSYNDMKEYFKGFSQILAIDFMIKTKINQEIKIDNKLLILPLNFSMISLHLSTSPSFIDWIRKPIYQLSKTIFNDNPDKAIELWKKGLINPNCDESSEYCKEGCCIHVLNKYYNDNIDVRQMSELILMLKKS